MSKPNTYKDAKFGWKCHWVSGSWEENCLNVVNVLIAIIFHWPFISTNLNSLYATRKKTKIGSGEQKRLLIYAGNRGSIPGRDRRSHPTDLWTQSVRKNNTADDQSFGMGVSSFFIGYKNRQSCQKYAKGPVPLTDEYKEYAKGHQSFGVGFIRFHPL